MSCKIYEFLNLSIINNNFEYDCVCIPPLTDQEIEELKKAGYSYTTDGRSCIYTFIFSEKEHKHIDELESILNYNRNRIY